MEPSDYLLPPLIIAAITGLIFWGMFALGEPYDDQKADQARYCEMVREGVWPDYRETFAEECE